MLVVPIDPVNGRHYQIDYGRTQDLNTELASFLFGSKGLSDPSYVRLKVSWLPSKLAKKRCPKSRPSWLN